jgi:hypothetical protein
MVYVREREHIPGVEDESLEDVLDVSGFGRVRSSGLELLQERSD